MAFIVIEGLDGAGKSTQVELLSKYLQTEGKSVEYVHFPTGNSEIFGDMVNRFLRGEFKQRYDGGKWQLADNGGQLDDDTGTSKWNTSRGCEGR